MGFFKSSPEQQSNANFENCQNKTVENTDFVSIVQNSPVRATNDLSNETVPYRGSSAELHCPRTSDDRVTVEVPFTLYQERSDALSKLKREAGKQICGTCVYASLNPLEVSQYDAQVAKSELEKVENMKARALALAELAEIDPDYKHMS